MITTTQAYKDKILSDHREMKMKVIFNGRQEIDGHYLKNVTIHEVSNGLDTLTIGGICSNSIKIDMFDPGNIPFEGGSLEAFIGIQLASDIEWVPMGSFFISEITRNNDYEVSLEGYDGISLLNDEYTPRIEYPAMLETVVLDITNQCGLTLKQQVFEEIMIENPMDVTCKEMLGYMASLMGMNARMNRFSGLEFYWYESGQYVIPLESQYQLGFKKTNSALTISSLTSGDEENVMSVGSGYGITFANPYMTQERLESLFEKINGFPYTPATLKWRGDPSLEVCDILHVQESTKDMSQILIMEHTLSFDGGMSSTIESNGQNEKEVVMSKSPTEIKLKKFYNTLIESYKQTTEKILGHDGGYYVIDVDENGYPNGWTIMNTPTLRDDTHLWKMSMGGFGYSQDGGKTFENFAFDLDGNFSANAINTGQLNGDEFELNLETGTILIGERDSDGQITHPVFSYDRENGLTIEAMKELKKEVNTIKNNISVSITSNFVNQQTFDEQPHHYYPDYTVQPLKLNAIVKDTLQDVMSEATITWKRKGRTDQEYVDLLEHEIAEGSLLTISQNLEESVEYKAYASVLTVDQVELHATASLTMNYSVLKDTKVNGEICSIEASATSFVEDQDNYSPGNITLIPHTLNCHFDIWSYSTDLGLSYINIEPILTLEDDTHILKTNVEGITFHNETNELMISNDCVCFDYTNIVVFKLKCDVEDANDTIALTKESDIATQVNHIVSEMNQLSEQYHSIVQDLDAVNGTITSKVEDMETKYNGNIEEINKKLTTVIQTSESIEEQYQTLKEIIDENGSDLQTITTYIRKTAKGIEVGELEANVKTLMAPSYFAILFNDEEVMKLEQNLLTIERIKALSVFQLGDAIFTTKANGFDITWGGQ